MLDAIASLPLGITGSPRPPLPASYASFVNPNGLVGARIGVTRQGIDGAEPHTAAVFDDALAAMTAAGAILTDLDAAPFTFPPGDGELLVLLFEFVTDLKNYFATRVGVPMAGKTLAEAIAFNEANAGVEMPFFGQEIFELANSLATGPDDPQPGFTDSQGQTLTYNKALEIDRLAGGPNGIDAALGQFAIDAIATPTGTPTWPNDLINGDHFSFGTSGLAAIVGYPIINVPMGNVFGLPVGISFIGTAFSEGTLIRIASGFEAKTHARIAPQFFTTLPLDNVGGVPLTRARRGRGHGHTTAHGHMHHL